MSSKAERVNFIYYQYLNCTKITNTKIIITNEIQSQYQPLSLSADRILTVYSSTLFRWPPSGKWIIATKRTGSLIEVKTIEKPDHVYY